MSHDHWGRDHSDAATSQRMPAATSSQKSEGMDSSLEPTVEGGSANTLVSAQWNGFQTSGFQSWKRIKFCCFKPITFVVICYIWIKRQITRVKGLAIKKLIQFALCSCFTDQKTKQGRGQVAWKIHTHSGRQSKGLDSGHFWVSQPFLRKRSQASGQLRRPSNLLRKFLALTNAVQYNGH